MKRLLIILLVLIASVSWAADVKISNLPATTTLDDTDVMPAVAGTTTSKITVANLKTLFGYHAGVTLSTTLGANLLGLSTQQLTLDDQTANYVFAGPTTGEAAAPSFRALVAADIPSLVSTYQPLNATLTALAAQTETEGSIQYYTADATPAVLAKGTSYQLLNMNSGATAPAWTYELGATDTRLTKIWATDLEVTNAPTVNGAALTTILQPLNDDLTTLAGGGTANCIWGEKSDGSGIECKKTLNLQMDDSAAQFKSATASKGTLKFLLSGSTDAALMTIASGQTEARTLTLPDATDTLIGKATTDTLTNKTLDVDGTGNVVKSWGYLVLTHPHLCSADAPMQTTSTTRTYGHCKFGNAKDKATNYAEYYLVVPADIDTSVDLVGTFKFKLGGADTADHEYEISFDSVADSAAYAGSLGDAVSLAYTADAAGAEGDVETATGTLTGWKAAMTAGQLFVIRVARDGDHATDASTVDSYSGPLVIKYKITQ